MAGHTVPISATTVGPLVQLITEVAGRKNGVVSVTVPVSTEQGAGALIRKMSATSDLTGTTWHQSITRHYKDKRGRPVETCTALDDTGALVVTHTVAGWHAASDVHVSWPAGTCIMRGKEEAVVPLDLLREREDHVEATKIRQARVFRAPGCAWHIVVALDWEAVTLTDALHALRTCVEPTIRVEVIGSHIRHAMTTGGALYVAVDALLKLAFVLNLALLGNDGVLIPENLPHFLTSPNPKYEIGDKDRGESGSRDQEGNGIKHTVGTESAGTCYRQRVLPNSRAPHRRRQASRSPGGTALECAP